MELFLDVLGESLVDTAKMLPFLFLAYLLIEYIETRHGERIEALLAGGGRWGAVPGAVLGCVPQCGFSAIASNFYASRVITLGTLMAVGLMMLPAITARLWAQTVGGMLITAITLALGSGLGGLLCSYHFDLPSGPAIILFAGSLYLLSLVFAPAGGVLPRLIRQRHLAH